MNALVHITMFGWIPLVLAGALVFSPRRVILASYVIAWMFLPCYSYKFQGLPEFDKTTATNLAALLVVLFVDSRRLLGVRSREDDRGHYEWSSAANVAGALAVMSAGLVRRLFVRMRWFDAPAIVWCLCPIASSVANDLGVYDGLAHALQNTITWGIPYLIGRLYFSEPEALRDVALAVVVGGLVYVPLCLWEIRMSPLLHDYVYGFHQHLFSQSFRGGLYRPTVFMRHGLMVSMWMSTACLMALYSRRMGRYRGVFGLPTWIETGALVFTLVLCQSWAATTFFFVGAAVRWLDGRSRKAWFLGALVFIPVLYIGLRGSGMWSGDNLVSAVSRVSDERAQSIGFRFQCETVLVNRALESPVFGWGGWGRNYAPIDEEGEILAIADGTWIRVFGEYGAVGVVSLFGLLMLPVWRFRKRMRPREWRTPATAAAATLCVSVALYSIDSLVNDMVNPIFVLVAGGLNAIQLAAPAPRANAVPASEMAEKEREPVLAS